MKSLFRIGVLVGVLMGLPAAGFVRPAVAQSTVAARVTVTTAATLIATGRGDSTVVVVKNADTGTIDIGPSTVTSGTGFRLLTDEGISVVLKNGQTLYGIAASGSSVIDVIYGVGPASRSASANVTTGAITASVSTTAGSPLFVQPSDGTTAQKFATVDADTGAPTDNRVGVILMSPGSGGAVATGIAAVPLQVSLANTGANATAVKVDGSAVTQPISATNLSTNIAQINGVTPLMGNGATGTGALRVSIANDSTGIVALTTGSAQIGHLEANQSSNVAQINGVTVLMGNGVSGTGAQRVTLASDSTGTVNAKLQDGSGNAIASNANGGTRAIAAVIYDASGNAVTAFSGSGGTASNFGSAIPSAGTAAGFSDGTNMQLARVIDGDTGAGTVYTLATNLVKRTSGGPTELIGQALMAASLPVTLASDQSALTVSATNLSTNIAQMNGVTVTMGNGASGTGVQRVTLANDSTGIVALTTGSAQIGHLEANQSANVAQINGVTPLMGNGATGTGALRVSIANDSTGIVALTTGSAQIGHLEANQSTNIAQMNGVATTMGNGVSGTGVQRVTLASDSTGQVALAAGAATIGALTANQSVNISQMNGVTTTMGNGVSGTGVQRVTLASDSTGILAAVTSITNTVTVAGAKTNNNAAPGATNVGVLGSLANASAPSWTEGNLVAGSVDLHGSTRTTLLDSSGAAVTLTADQTLDAAIGTTGPLMVGRGSTATPTAMTTDGDATAVWLDLNGRVHLFSDVTQGSTTSGQTNRLIAGAVTTSSPTYTSGQTSPLSLDTAGSLRVSIIGGSSANPAASATGSAVPSSADYVGLNVGGGTLRGQTGVNPTGSQYAGDMNVAAIAGAVADANSGNKSAGTLRVVLATDQPALTNKLLVTADIASAQTLATVTTVGTVTTVSTVTALTGGSTAHDAPGASINPIAIGGYASSTAPSDVSATNDIVRAWFLHSGAQVTAPSFAGVAAVAGNGASGTGVQRVTIANDSTGIIALTTGSAQIGHLEANQSSNVAQLAGTTTDTNSGTKSAGTLRVVIATDQPALTNKLLVTPDLPSGASTAAKQPALGTAGSASADVITIQGIASMTKLLVTPDANSAVNVAQINGVTTLMGNGVTGTGSQRVTIASDNTVLAAVGAGATGAAVPANAVYASAQDASGNLIGDIVCNQSKIYDASTSGNTELVAISGSKHIYVCSYTIFSAGTANVSLVAGTGTACASAASGATSTGTSGASAALTPAYQLIAQTGKVAPVPTHGYLYDAGSANALCLKTSAGVAVQAEVWYSQR